MGGLRSPETKLALSYNYAVIRSDRMGWRVHLGIMYIQYFSTSSNRDIVNLTKVSIVQSETLQVKFSDEILKTLTILAASIMIRKMASDASIEVSTDSKEHMAWYCSNKVTHFSVEAFNFIFVAATRRVTQDYTQFWITDWEKFCSDDDSHFANGFVICCFPGWGCEECIAALWLCDYFRIISIVDETMFLYGTYWNVILSMFDNF